MLINKNISRQNYRLRNIVSRKLRKFKRKNMSHYTIEADNSKLDNDVVVLKTLVVTPKDSFDFKSLLKNNFGLVFAVVLVIAIICVIPRNR